MTSAPHITRIPRPVARGRGRRPAVGPPPAGDEIGEQGHDEDRILVLIAVFTVAAFAVVGVLIGAAAIGTWWALAGLMAVHFTMTAMAFAGVAFVFSGRLRSPRGPAHHPPA